MKILQMILRTHIVAVLGSCPFAASCSSSDLGEPALPAAAAPLEIAPDNVTIDFVTPVGRARFADELQHIRENRYDDDDWRTDLGELYQRTQNLGLENLRRLFALTTLPRGADWRQRFQELENIFRD